MKAYERSLRRAALAAEYHVAKRKYPARVSPAAGLASSLSSGISDSCFRLGSGFYALARAHQTEIRK